MRIDTIFKYVGLSAIALLLLGLGGWYIFLRGQTNSAAQLDESRGLGSAIPSFLGSRGSTIANIASNLGLSTDTGSTSPEALKPPRLWRANATPIAGMNFLSGTSTLRYIERSTGYVVDINPVTGSVVRRTNTLMPQTYAAHVTGAGGVVLQSLNENLAVKTFTGTLSTTTTDGYAQLVGRELALNIASITTSPSVDDILYLIRASGPTLFIQSKLSGQSPKQIASLGISGWNIHWLLDGTIAISEKTGSGISGSAFRVSKQGTLTGIVRNIPGLSLLLHASSSAVLYSSDTGKEVSLYLKPSAESTAVALPIRTLAEKCVWLPKTMLSIWCAVPKTEVSPSFMNLWYRGLMHTSDNWWRIEGGGGATEEIFKMNEVEAIEVEQPIIDSSGEYIAFINGWDKSLWILRIKE